MPIIDILKNAIQADVVAGITWLAPLRANNTYALAILASAYCQAIDDAGEGAVFPHGQGALSTGSSAKRHGLPARHRFAVIRGIPRTSEQDRPIGLRRRCAAL